jgi:hypothetical protein
MIKSFEFIEVPFAIIDVSSSIKVRISQRLP